MKSAGKNITSTYMKSAGKTVLENTSFLKISSILKELR